MPQRIGQILMYVRTYVCLSLEVNVKARSLRLTLMPCADIDTDHAGHSCVAQFAVLHIVFTGTKIQKQKIILARCASKSFLMAP